MLSSKIMLSWKCSVAKKNTQITMLSWEKNTQIRCSDMLRTHLSTNNHCASSLKPAMFLILLDPTTQICSSPMPTTAVSPPPLAHYL